MVPMRFSVFLVVLAMFGSGEGIRLCGPKLADLLNHVCEKLGGFHAPKRDVSGVSVNKRVVVGHLTLRSESDMELRGGVVDECCRKQCTMATLVSYCANSANIGNIDLEDILPMNSGTAISAEDIAEYRQLQQESESDESSAFPHFSQSSRPNLGQFMRNRPVFMVLSELQDED